MPLDPHTNFAYGTVATPPAPASSGTTLGLTAGHGTRFPATSGGGYYGGGYYGEAYLDEGVQSTTTPTTPAMRGVYATLTPANALQALLSDTAPRALIT